MSEGKIKVTVELDRETLDFILKEEKKTLERIYANSEHREHALKNMSNESAVYKALLVYCQLMENAKW